MKIVFLDAKSIGEDIDLSGYDQLGEVVRYPYSTPEEAREQKNHLNIFTPVSSKMIKNLDRGK